MSESGNEQLSTDGEYQVEIAALDRKHTQLRVSMSADAVADYAETLKNPKNDMPPIIVFEDEGGTLYLGDGFHRCEAAESIGRKNILATVRPGTLEDAILYAANCNKHNAVRFSNRDKRKAIATLINTFPKKSQRWLAEQCGVSQAFVSKYLAESAEAASTSSSATVRKTTAEKFEDSASKTRSLLEQLIDAGELDPQQPIVVAGMVAVVEAATLIGRRFPNAMPSDNGDRHTEDDADTIDAESVSVRLLDAPEGDWYEDADTEDDVVVDVEPKRKQGRPKARYKVNGSRETWFAEDTAGDGSDLGPFKTKAEAHRACVEANKGVTSCGT